MAKTIWKVAAIGFVIAIVLGATWFAVVDHAADTSEAVFTIVTFVLWPTAVMMGPDAEGFFGVILLVVSAVLNAAVYAGVAALILLASKWVARLRAARDARSPS